MKPIWILRRYVVLEYLRWFVFCLIGFTSIAVVVDLFEKASTFLDHHAGFDLIARYTLYQLPEFVSYLIAPSVLIAMLVALAGMTKRNEITAILAGGVGRRSIVAPMALLALVLSAGEFVVSEYVLPEANAQKRYVYDVVIRGRSYAKFSDRRNRWFYADGGFLRVDAIDTSSKILHGVLLLEASTTPSVPGERIEGRAAQWNDAEKAWDLFDVRTATVDTSGQLSIAHADETKLPISLKPDDLTGKVSATEEWGVRDLQKIIRDRKRLGQDVRNEQVDLETRFAFPLAGFVMALLGAPFAFKEQRRGGAAASFLTGIVIAFAYYVVLRFGVAVGKAGGLHPWIAAWLPNLIFGGVGMYLSWSLDAL